MPDRPVVDRSLGVEIGWGLGIAFILWLVVVGILGALHLVALAIITFMLIILGLVVWIIFVINRYNEEKNWVDSQSKLYPTMERIWNDLYYCFRDDVVFRGSLPTASAPPSRMIEFLVDQAS